MFNISVSATVLVMAAISPCGLFGSIPAFTPAQSPQPSFEAATIKPGTPGDRSGKFAHMQSSHQFVVRNYTLKDLIGFAYDLPLRRISGGPSWAEGDMYNILAATPGDERPNQSEEMAMVRRLLEERFQLRYHLEQRELPVYQLSVAKSGARLKESLAPVDAALAPVPELTNVGFAGSRIETHARYVTIAEFASMLQRSVFDRPVVDKTNLTGRYDFDLAWSYDDSQFDGKLPPINLEAANRPSLFSALQTELGLTLESSRAEVETIIIDSVQKPSEN
jgi:uncharacterized protein (TIGR03435 family)